MFRYYHDSLVVVFILPILILLSASSCKKESEKIMSVSNDSILAISYTSAKAYATIIDIGEGIEQYGHLWSTSASLTVVDNEGKTQHGSTHMTGSFSSDMTNLSPGTKYYVRAYILNSGNVVYGDVILPFHTLATGLPVVITGTAGSITETGATVSGNLENLGSGASSVSQHGHCWSNETTTPTLADNSTSLGSKSTTGTFESVIVGLSQGELYYVRAYATNNAGTGYGSIKSFSTAITVGVPELTTTAVSSITGTTATSGGTITSEGGSAITARGICWDESAGPTTSDNYTYEGSGAGSFESTMTGLAQKTKYYVRAYATNASGTGYGNEIVFTTNFDCGTRYTDSRDGKSYLTVLIGDQCWMAENLNVGDKITGMKIPGNNGVIEKHCYNDDEANCDLYGALYRWNEMMNYTTVEMTQGICPKGWHIPSDYEWKILENELGMGKAEADAAGWRGTDEGGKLKAAGTTYWEDPNTGATNSSLFTALPAGGLDNEGNYSGLGYYTDYWTSTLIIDTQCWYRYLSADESRIYRVDGNRDYGTSVRCVEDD
jgi:uncharacterized protein (TIGR02145 family)